MPTREIYWNITGGAWIYLLALAAAVVIVRGIHGRVRLWRMGRSEKPVDRIVQRGAGLLLEVLAHRRQLRDPLPGVAHLMIFYGFLAQFVATSLISLQEWTGIPFLQGTFYRWYSLLSDSFGLVALVGIALILVWRGVVRPQRLHPIRDDGIALGLLLLLFLQGFAVEGLRIAQTELRQQPELALWSPGGWIVASAFAGMAPERLLAFHTGVWWFHAVTAMVFLGYLVHGKLVHVFYGLISGFLRSLEPSGKLVHPDIEALVDEEPEALDSLGVGQIEEWGWKGLLELDACVNCGRCDSVCPAHLSGSALSPRKLVQDLRKHMDETGARLRDPAAVPSTRPTLVGETAPGPAILDEELWGCRTCGACQRECPVFVEHVPKIVDMRRHLVMTRSRMGEEVRGLLKSVDERMHPWSGSSPDREAWFQDLDLKVFGRGDRATTLFWVGCTGAMIDRNVQATRALAKVLQSASEDFAVLGSEELCTGDPARRLGGELSFQTCARMNVETFERYGIRRIVTACPHCFNTLKNEYPDFGGHYEVLHHTQLIRDLLGGGRLRLSRSLESVTYHDPCYLGRHNEVYDAPREVLSAVARDGGFREVARNRSGALCCGSGGGHAWMDEPAAERVSHIRMRELQGCGAGTAAMACPFCLQMLEDAAGTLDPQRRIRTLDVAEVVAEALEEG